MPAGDNNRQQDGLPPHVASEDIIAIGDDRYAHFRRDRRFAQVQVAFTAPSGVDPNPGRALTDRFKEQGWTCRKDLPRKPWVHPLDKSSDQDPTARGDSRDVLHEQFVDIIQEYRQKQGLPSTSGWKNLMAVETASQSANRLPTCDVPSDEVSATGEDKEPRSGNQETRAGGGAEPADQARDMLGAFASVRARCFDLTLTDAAGGKAGFRRNLSLGQFKALLPDILADATSRRLNVIVRPRAAGALLIQLDDLGEAAAQRLRPLAFLTQRTSPGNFQVWVAVADGDASFARRLRQGTGADLTASGATRISGSLNVKERYAPVFPRVETVHSHPGRVVRRTELEALGFVAAPEQIAPPPRPASPSSRPGARAWPSYQRCLENAPPARGGGRPDISRADYTWCLIAIDWGWSAEETADRLMQESGKAQENGEPYALRTARSAAAALEQRHRRGR